MRKYIERSDVVLEVRDLMAEHIISIDAGKSIIATAKLMDKHKLTSILVSHGTVLHGIITDRDIISRTVSKGLDPRS